MSSVGTARFRAPPDGRYMGPAELARLTGLSLKTLTNRRGLGLPPQFMKAGQRVPYDRADVGAWLRSSAADTSRGPDA